MSTKQPKTKKVNANFASSKTDADFRDSVCRSSPSSSSKLKSRTITTREIRWKTTTTRTAIMAPSKVRNKRPSAMTAHCDAGKDDADAADEEDDSGEGDGDGEGDEDGEFRPD